MKAPFTLAQIERFKREAKQIHRVSELSHSQALDQIAKANGYGNWSQLMKHSDTGEHLATGKPHPPFQFKRTTDEMRLALHKVPEPQGWGTPTRVDCAKAQVADVSREFVSAQNVVTFAVDYMKCLLTVPRFKVYSVAPAYWEMRLWLPYCCKSVGEGVYILVNRNYKLAGQVGEEWANYEDSPRLHARIDGDLYDAFTVSGASDGYLFNDGCTPWHSRTDARAYLERLHILQRVLQG